MQPIVLEFSLHLVAHFTGHRAHKPDVGGQNVECTLIAKKNPIQGLRPHYKHLGHMTMKSTKSCESSLAQNIINLPKTKLCHAAHSQNVELIGSHIGGSADLTVGHFKNQRIPCCAAEECRTYNLSTGGSADL